MTGRNVIDCALPEFAVHLSNLSVPDERTWSSFATRSAERVTIRSLLPPSTYDGYIYGRFGLSPVSTRPEVGVFGKVTHYKADAVRGELIAPRTPPESATARRSRSTPPVASTRANTASRR